MTDYLSNEIVDMFVFWVRLEIITVQRKSCMLKDILADIILVERS